ncbi:Dehydrogenase FUM7 [Paramyrothecium foliicola]|nr:Dehydrogenase FUM7 [Paramyrothecium foliicola]
MSFEFGDEVYRQAFDGRDTPKVSFGVRFPEATLRHCQDEFLSSKIYVICSRSLANNTDALQRLRSSLGDRVAGVRIGITSHTPISEVLEIVKDAASRDIDCLVTLGAGSLTDGAKLVRFALANSVTTQDGMNTLWGTAKDNPEIRKDISRPKIPLIHIPTSLSGGEYQAIAGGTESSGFKRMFNCEGRDPELVIQDPELCLTTPSSVWFSTGIRAVGHCVETLCSLQSNDDADRSAAGGLPKLVSGLLEAHADPKSLAARHKCQQGVVEAMRAVSNGVPMGASHAIGHQLGPLGVGHGETSCILLPAVCKYNLAQGANVERQAKVRDLLVRQNDVQKLLRSKNLDSHEINLDEVLDIIISALGMPRTLEDVGLKPEAISDLAKNSLNDVWIQTNPVPIKEESQVNEILQLCLRR